VLLVDLAFDRSQLFRIRSNHFAIGSPQDYQIALTRNSHADSFLLLSHQSPAFAFWRVLIVEALIVHADLRQSP
jgi:hypothetical protein